jgi:hypothetical protein
VFFNFRRRETAVSEIVSRLNNGELLFLVILMGGFLLILVGILASAWLKARQLEVDAALKKDMLTRGMSSDEIRTVIEAGSRGKQTAAILHAMAKQPEEAERS